MDGTDQAASTLWYVLALVLVGSALLARRLPMGGMIRMALLWVVIFAGLLGLFTLAERGAVVSGDVPPSLPAARTEGQALRIPVAPDGHYWVEGTINGAPTRFLIDSGATITAVSEQSARAAGLNFELQGPGVIMTTANGKIEAKRARVATLAIGPVRASDIDVVVSPAFGEVNVIGMNLLSKLKSWSVQNGEMVLTP